MPEPGEAAREVKDHLFGATTRQIVQQEGDSCWLNFIDRHFPENPTTPYRAGIRLRKRNLILTLFTVYAVVNLQTSG